MDGTKWALLDANDDMSQFLNENQVKFISYLNHEEKGEIPNMLKNLRKMIDKYGLSASKDEISDIYLELNRMKEYI